MIYKNDDLKALSGTSDEFEDESKFCAVCGTENPEEFYVSIQTDECVGCSDCVNVVSWIDY